MDLQAILERIEKDFFARLDRKTGWRKTDIEDARKEFDNAVRNVLVLTYSRIMKDAKETKDGP